MRRLIEQRLATLRDDLIEEDDPSRSLLRHVVGPVSDDLRQVLADRHREAAVLLPLVERPGGLTLLFTARADHLPHHAGQVSFPGGVINPPDESAIQAALREAHEEIALEPSQVVIAGRLRRHLTGTGFTVTPVVGFVTAEFEPVPDPTEVEAVFEVPLEVLLAPGTIRSAIRERFGTRFRSFELDYEGRRIWGATAAILVTFIGLISHEKAI